MSETTGTVKYHPALMTAEMVSATLADLKGQTRRGMKPQPQPFAAKDTPGPFWQIPFKGWPEGRIRQDHISSMLESLCPYGVPGDRLWIRESHWQFGQWFPAEADGGPKKRKKRWAIYAKLPICIRYGEEKPTSTPGGNTTCHWRRVPGIHMPRWAARLTLEITAIRVERVQDISFDDCWAEGLYKWLCSDYAARCKEGEKKAQSLGKGFAWGAFAALWDSINGKREGFAWADNPWVFVIVFKRLETT